MTRNVASLAVILALLVSSIAFAGSVGDTFSGKVTMVLSNAKLIVQKEDRQGVLVRLAGIQVTDEAKAKAFLEETAKGKTAEVEITDVDGNQIAARVTVEGVDLAEALVKEGLASKK